MKGKNWISKTKLIETLSLNYKDFCDERCRLIPVELFLLIFSYKYGDCDIDWGFYIEDKTLVCENVSKFQFRFPLS